MREILHDISTPALVTAIEANLFGLFTMFRHWRQAEVHDDSDLLWTVTDVSFPLFNSILRAQFAPDGIDDAIEAAITPYKSRNVPILWWTGPATQPAELDIYLEAHGFVYDDDSQGMAVDMELLREDVSVPQDFVIEEVAENEILRKWCQTNIVGFEWPDFLNDALFNFYFDLGSAEKVPLFHYIGRLNDEPVATSSLFLGAGVAGIYNVVTLPEARRKGIGAAMTLKPLLEARAMGYRIGILQASEMGASVYRKLGFQEYCKIGHYVMESEPASGG